MIVKKVSEDLRSHEVRELWLEYWQHYSKKHDEYCSEAHCLNHSSDGVLVTCNCGEQQGKVFVIPLCEAHCKNLQGQLEIGDQTEVIPSNLTL
ncbi:hypothetical protein LDJ79_16860 [Vibrio tritonius]|uniref:Uncharacterized protein n=1 Tax=Vibrio tritonius TaxID=1435069 RepID=A0ABS7YQ53_9VIBR|nr:hypothetical protein [Vibrio tritonius]MCA2017793.1 hypothetical protein [Vibrio tritonius]